LDHGSDLSGSRDVIGHVSDVTLIPRRPFPTLYHKPFPRHSIANGTHSNGRHDLKQPLNKGQGRSFWYQAISHIRLGI